MGESRPGRKGLLLLNISGLCADLAKKELWGTCHPFPTMEHLPPIILFLWNIPSFQAEGEAEMLQQ